MSGRLRDSLIPPLAAGFIRGLKSTLRLEWRGREIVEKLRAEKRPYIHAFWHGRLLLMPYAYFGDKITILISKHGDGELIARTMRRFGHESTRGSTSAGSVEAFKELVRKARDGYDIGYTPDGPRGPRYSSTAGPIQLARMTGLPIVPVTFSARKKKSSAAGTTSCCLSRSPRRSSPMAPHWKSRASFRMLKSKPGACASSGS
jgi:hypothetical protein